MAFVSAASRGMSAFLLAALIGACVPGLGGFTATPQEALPAPGSIHLTSDPAQAPRALSLRYLYRGEPSGISDEFVAGATVAVTRSLLPEPHGIAVNGQPCEGEFEIAIGIETDLVLFVPEVGCRVETVGSHPEGARDHGDSAAYLFGAAPLGSQVSIRPITPGLVTAARNVSTDESGSFSFESVPAGRYEVTLIVDGHVTTTVEIELGPGDERYISLSGVPE